MVTKKKLQKLSFSEESSYIYEESCDFDVMQGFCVHTFDKDNILVIVILLTSPLNRNTKEGLLLKSCSHLVLNYLSNVEQNPKQGDREDTFDDIF